MESFVSAYLSQIFFTNFLFSSHFTILLFIDEIIANFFLSHLLLLALTFLFGVLPSFILIRLALQNEYTSSLSNAHNTLSQRIWTILVSTKSVPFLIIYSLQGWVFAFAYCVSVGVREWEDPRLSIFAPSQ
jgi:hypothetical protein